MSQLGGGLGSNEFYGSNRFAIPEIRKAVRMAFCLCLCDDGERKTWLTRQIAFEPLPASILLGVVAVVIGRGDKTGEQALAT